MKNLIILIAVLTIIVSCDDDPTKPTGTISNDWVIKPDSVNIAILILSSDYTLEGGMLKYYAPCDGCSADSIPFTKSHSYDQRRHKGTLSFSYSATSDLIFSATSSRSELGQVVIPAVLMPPDSFKAKYPMHHEPADPERWKFRPEGLMIDSGELITETDQCWEAINRFDIVRAFNKSGRYRIGYLNYWLGPGDDSIVQKKWIIFLFKENE